MICLFESDEKHTVTYLLLQEPENLEGLFSGRTPTFSKAASCKAAEAGLMFGD